MHEMQTERNKTSIVKRLIWFLHTKSVMSINNATTYNTVKVSTKALIRSF